MTIDWNTQFATRTQLAKRSAVRELLKLTAQPDMISFAGGLPAPELFPVEQVKVAADAVLSEYGRQALQYGETEGHRAAPRLGCRPVFTRELRRQTRKCGDCERRPTRAGPDRARAC